ncbi:hypothetical protein NPA08_00395 [Mycoplasmopsis citelli]|uniref:hypothetical protein n=1 Tax=Mycoplasmopsis citelli TaxID=171281 RepID=UPI002115B9B6|nr:hypothetical protein [Mycoplasmopsis citelli]UUD36285.1 hypothetical protein NPA08_00395 [Mycoplasmopsis citelli]
MLNINKHGKRKLKVIKNFLDTDKFLNKIIEELQNINDDFIKNEYIKNLEKIINDPYLDYFGIEWTFKIINFDPSPNTVREIIPIFLEEYEKSSWAKKYLNDKNIMIPKDIEEKFNEFLKTNKSDKKFSKISSQIQNLKEKVPNNYFKVNLNNWSIEQADIFKIPFWKNLVINLFWKIVEPRVKAKEFSYHSDIFKITDKTSSVLTFLELANGIDIDNFLNNLKAQASKLNNHKKQEYIDNINYIFNTCPSKTLAYYAILLINLDMSEEIVVEVKKLLNMILKIPDFSKKILFLI